MMVAVVVPCVQSIDNSCDKRSNGFVGGDPKAQPTTAGKTDRSTLPILVSKKDSVGR